MPAHPEPLTAPISMTRTEAYTDGVFAIAATLLVLDLTATSIGSVGDSAQMWAALVGMWPNFFSFVLSFALLSLLWTVHLQQFRFIERVDPPMLWLNHARLLFVVLLPFTTSLTADYQEFLAGRVLFPLNFFFAVLFGYLSWKWAASSGGHLLNVSSSATLRVQNAAALASVICAAIAVSVSPWLGSLGFLVFFLRPRLTSLMTSRRRKSRSDAA